MKSTVLLIALLVGTAAAGAAEFQHPAVFSPRELPGIDPNTFLVGHPAGGAPGVARLADAPQAAATAVAQVPAPRPVASRAGGQRQVGVRLSAAARRTAAAK